MRTTQGILSETASLSTTYTAQWYFTKYNVATSYYDKSSYGTISTSGRQLNSSSGKYVRSGSSFSLNTSTGYYTISGSTVALNTSSVTTLGTYIGWLAKTSSQATNTLTKVFQAYENCTFTGQYDGTKYYYTTATRTSSGTNGRLITHTTGSTTSAGTKIEDMSVANGTGYPSSQGVYGSYWYNVLNITS